MIKLYKYSKGFIRLKGSSNSQSKLNESDVFNIRNLRKEGVKVKEISIKYNIKPSTVYSICNYRSWKHI